MPHPGREPPRAVPGAPRRFSTLRTPEIPPPPRLPSVGPPSGGASWWSLAPKWAIGIVVVVTVLGGASGVRAIAETFAPKAATAEQAAAIAQRIEAVEKAATRIEEKLDASTQAQARRNAVVAGWACRMNGERPTPIARNAPCGLAWEVPPLGSAGPWVAREEWPPE